MAVHKAFLVHEQQRRLRLSARAGDEHLADDRGLGASLPMPWLCWCWTCRSPASRRTSCTRSCTNGHTVAIPAHFAQLVRACGLGINSIFSNRLKPPRVPVRFSGTAERGSEMAQDRSDLLLPVETPDTSRPGDWAHDEGQTSPRPPERRVPAAVLALVGAITVGGLLLRLPSFNDSLMGDEISTFYIVHGHSIGRVMQLIHSNQETTPPLYFLVAWATKGLLGNEVQSIRLVSLVTGTAAIPLTFLLGIWTVGRRAALVGATCVALAPFMIYFSSEARPYMLVLFLALLSTLALLRAIDTGRVGWWVAYAVCTCAVAYTHYTVVFLLVAQLAWALWTQPKALKALLLANTAAAVAYLPWLGGLREDLRAPNFITTFVPVNLSSVSNIAENWWIGHPVILIRLLPGNLVVALAEAGLALGIVGRLLQLRGNPIGRLRGNPMGRSRVPLVFVLAIAPPLLIALYSWTRADVLGGGNQISSWPGLALAIGWLVTSPPKPLRFAAVTLTVGAFAVGGFAMLYATNQRTDIGAAVAFMNRPEFAGVPIVSSPYFNNPISELDVALAVSGDPTYVPGNADRVIPPTEKVDHPVIRLTGPALADQLVPLDGPRPQPASKLPTATPQVVARKALSLAHRHMILLVSPNGPTPTVLKYFPHSAISQFFKDLPAGSRVIEHRTYPGLSGLLPESVFVITVPGPTGGS